MKRVIKTTSAAAMYNPVSQATVAPNGMLYTAGMVGRSPESGEMLASFDDQAHQALRNLGALLREAGGGYPTSCSCSSTCSTWEELINSTRSSGPTFPLSLRRAPYANR